MREGRREGGKERGRGQERGVDGERNSKDSIQNKERC